MNRDPKHNRITFLNLHLQTTCYKMRMLLPVLAFLFFLKTIEAQNLISNPSLEEYTNCPEYNSGISNVVGWGDVSYCTYKNRFAYANTTDYYNTCKNDYPSDPNFNYCGWQKPANGNGYIGIVNYSKFIKQFHEQPYSKLTSTLQSNQYYKISFYISLADRSNYRLNKIAVSFLPNDPSNSDDRPVGFKITEMHLAKEVSTNSWVLATGIYKAIGGEKFLIIDRLQNSTIVDRYVELISDERHHKLDQVSYVYLDDFELIEAKDEKDVDFDHRLPEIAQENDQNLSFRLCNVNHLFTKTKSKYVSRKEYRKILEKDSFFTLHFSRLRTFKDYLKHHSDKKAEFTLISSSQPGSEEYLLLSKQLDKIKKRYPKKRIKSRIEPTIQGRYTSEEGDVLVRFF